MYIIQDLSHYTTNCLPYGTVVTLWNAIARASNGFVGLGVIFTGTFLPLFICSFTSLSIVWYSGCCVTQCLRHHFHCQFLYCDPPHCPNYLVVRQLDDYHPNHWLYTHKWTHWNIAVLLQHQTKWSYRTVQSCIRVHEPIIQTEPSGSTICTVVCLRGTLKTEKLGTV